MIEKRNIRMKKKKPPLEFYAKYLLIEFCRLYSPHTLDQLTELFTKDVQAFGAALWRFSLGIDELRKYLQHNLTDVDHSGIEITSPIYCSSASPTWASCMAKVSYIVKEKKHVFKGLRLSVIVEVEDGQWKIAHIHASFPAVLHKNFDAFSPEK